MKRADAVPVLVAMLIVLPIYVLPSSIASFFWSTASA